MPVLTPWGPRVIWGPWDVFTCTDIRAFSVIYKHVNSKGVNSIYIAQTGLP